MNTPAATLHVLDWLVILVYGLGMIAVGWYYSRRSENAEGYLLGGRRMNPTLVGLSLFATLFSTLTYLNLPGETIKNGPMFFAGLLVYPLIYLIVGWLLIPVFMRLNITSAYEILNARFGPAVRQLGVAIFLGLRLLWMGVVVYATADAVLVPLMGLSRASGAVPLVCAVLAIVTVIYTSLGGLRAVVLTDAVQSIVLFLGALVTLGLITVNLGGVLAWWPDQWFEGWKAPRLIGFGSDARITFVGAMVAVGTWYICTMCSDQVAIQRYLATQDARAARRVMLGSLIANAAVQLLLAAVGLALFVYARQGGAAFLAGLDPTQVPDQLFPRFIAGGLPVGLSGLVIAGLLAAAMSSLSSGINSACSVVTVDIVPSLTRRELTPTTQVRLAQWVSVGIGLVIIALSSGVGLLEGNLLEVTFKTANLLVTPLGGLFLIAIFVRRANPVSVYAGALVGITISVAINYWDQFTDAPGISFIWAMPFSLVGQLAVSMALGWLPSLTPSPMLADLKGPATTPSDPPPPA